MVNIASSNKQIFASNLKKYMGLFHIDRKKLCNDLGLKYSTVCEWLSANKFPRIDKIELLANYFNIQKSDLIEGSSICPPFVSEYSSACISTQKNLKYSETFGFKLKHLRQCKQLTQTQLAEQLGLSFSTISMYERNQREPDLKMLKQIARFFQVTTDYLLKDY